MIELSEAMLVAAARDDWPAVAELERQRRVCLGSGVAAADRSLLEQLLRLNQTLLDVVAMHRTRAHAELTDMRRGQAASSQYAQVHGGV